MLRLTATDQSITMTTSATGSVDYISDWTDIVNATAVTTAGSGQGNVTTATTTTIIAAPASGSSRAVRSAMISNRHGSTSNTIQLFKTVGAASYAISKPLVLLAGETVRFSDEGFCFVGNACELEVASATTAEQLESNATTGVMQIVGPTAGTTRVVTIPDANATMARTDAAQTFTGNQTFSGRVLVDSTTDATTTTDGSLQTDGGLSVVKNAVIGGDCTLGAYSTGGVPFVVRASGGAAVSFGGLNSNYIEISAGSSASFSIGIATNASALLLLSNASFGLSAVALVNAYLGSAIIIAGSGFESGNGTSNIIGVSTSNTGNSKVIFNNAYTEQIRIYATIISCNL